MTNTITTNNISRWKSFGEGFSNNEKNQLVEDILRNVESAKVDAIFDGWLSKGTYRFIVTTTNLLKKIDSIASDVVMYYSIIGSELRELIVTTTNFEKAVLDKITEYVIEYEDLRGKYIDYCYAAAEDLKSVPENVEVYKKM